MHHESTRVVGNRGGGGEGESEREGGEGERKKERVSTAHLHRVHKIQSTTAKR